MIDDGTLLRRYVIERSEEAFAELVRRHLDLVYSAALRDLGGDVHRAKDVSQCVFTALAKKAASLCDRKTVAGWLHISAHHASAELMRLEERRQKREEEAHQMHNQEVAATPEPDWDQLRPVLNEVIEELGASDRDAVLLRFFEQLSFAEIGPMLRLNEDAVQKRVGRALAKIRSRLAARGIMSSSAALGMLLETQTVVAAPPGLAASIVSATAGGIATCGPLAAATLMTMNTVKIGIAAAVVIASATGIVWQHQSSARLRDEIATLRAQQSEAATIRIDNNRLATARDVADTEVMRLQSEMTRLRSELANAQIAEASPASPRTAATIISKDSFSASKDTPNSAAKTVRTAIDGGDPHALADTMVIAPQGQPMAKEAFDKLSVEKRVRYGTPERLIAELLCATTQSPTTDVKLLTEELPGARGMSPELADNPEYRTLHTQTQGADGRVRDSYQVFQKTSDGWRWVVSQGLVLKRLAETGLITVPQTKSRVP